MPRKPKGKVESVEGLSAQSAALFDELQSENARGTALVAAAFLENAIGQMLKRFFVDDPKLTDSLLENGNAPIGSFAIRIKLAYVLGLLGNETYDDLNTIREIRNAFAHGYQSASFSDQSIIDRCAGLKAWTKMKRDWKVGPRDCFISAVTQLVCEILLRGLSLQHAEPGKNFTVRTDHSTATR